MADNCKNTFIPENTEVAYVVSREETCIHNSEIVFIPENGAASYIMRGGDAEMRKIGNKPRASCVVQMR